MNYFMNQTYPNPREKRAFEEAEQEWLTYAEHVLWLILSNPATSPTRLLFPANVELAVSQHLGLSYHTLRIYAAQLINAASEKARPDIEEAETNLLKFCGILPMYMSDAGGAEWDYGVGRVDWNHDLGWLSEVTPLGITHEGLPMGVLRTDRVRASIILLMHLIDLRLFIGKSKRGRVFRYLTPVIPCAASLDLIHTFTKSGILRCQSLVRHGTPLRDITLEKLKMVPKG